FFRLKIKGKETQVAPSITERIFNIKLELIRKLERFAYQQEPHISYRNRLVEEMIGEINRLNRRHFVVKRHLKQVEKYSVKAAWEHLGDLDLNEIKEHLTPLIIPSDDDEPAKLFDHLIFTIELGELLGKNVNYHKEQVVK
ncbi:MAG TPA: DEAD/DEAH box helicase, partial [Firmicutes bacterium]|nr:DEAD/DEAH box helicase [Bacillota bacterium]